MGEELDYEVPMEDGYEPQPQQTQGVYHAGPKQNVITMLNNMVNKLNLEKGSLMGQLAGFKKLRNDYAGLYKKYLEINIAFEQAQNAWNAKQNEFENTIKSLKDKRCADLDVLHMAITKYPDITNMYIKVRMEGKRKSIEGQIAKLKAEIDALPL